MHLPLSICIPTYNRAGILARTLRRLSECQETFGEIVISDNASTDNTPEVVEEWRSCFRRLRYVRQPTHVDVCRNIYGVQSLGSEKYTFLLCDDDALIPSGIADAVAMLEADAECVAVFGGWERWDASLETAFAVLQPTYPGRYTRANRMEIARNGSVLTLPIVRSSVFQRHCFYDSTTFGMMRIVGQLLDHGAINVVTFPLYLHAETPGRQEDNLSKPYYHDMLKSDYEIYASAIEGVDLQMTTRLVVEHTLHAYMLGYQAARRQDAPLSERTFLLRYQASWGFADPGTGARHDAWERERLIAATLELLKDRIYVTGATRLVVEQGDMALPVMLAELRDGTPPMTLVPVASAQFAQFSPEPRDFIIAESWEGSGADLARPVAGRIAVGDLVASLRLPGSKREKVLLGRAGTTHLVLK